MFESSDERIKRKAAEYSARVQKEKELKAKQTRDFKDYTNPAQGLDPHLQGCSHINNCDCTPDAVRYAFDHAVLASAGQKAELTVLHLGAGAMKQVFSNSYALLNHATIKSVHAIVIEPLLLQNYAPDFMESGPLVKEMDAVVTSINREKAANLQKNGVFNTYTPANASNVPLRISRFTTVFSFYLACHPDRIQIMQDRERFNRELAIFDQKYPHHKPTKLGEYTQDMTYDGCKMDQDNNATIINNNSKKAALRLDMAVSIDLQAHTETHDTLRDCFNGIRAAQTLLLGDAQPLQIISCQEEVTMLGEDQYCTHYEAASIKREAHFPIESASKDSCCVM